MLTWLDRARSDPATVPGDNPASRRWGVSSTRSPDRINLIGPRRAQILAVEGLRILVSELEALDRIGRSAPSDSARGPLPTLSPLAAYRSAVLRSPAQPMLLDAVVPSAP